MIIDCISDLHGEYPELEGGDLLIIAGDLTASDKPIQYECFFDWLGKQQYKKKIFISGNHDNQAMSQFDWGENVEYLYDSGTQFEGLKIWGSPWSLWFYGINPHCKAFTATDRQLNKEYELIPDDTGILITHSPPYGIFDKIQRNPWRHDLDDDLHVGSVSLRNHVMMRVKPKLHVFGHIHEGGGNILDTNVTKFINCSYMNEDYEPVNKPIRIIL